MALLHDWNTRRETALLIRYEDLVRTPNESIRALLKHVGVNSDVQSVELMVKQLKDGSNENDVHRTTPDAEKSIGRWRRDLDSNMQLVCEDVFGPALQAFGYTI